MKAIDYTGKNYARTLMKSENISTRSHSTGSVKQKELLLEAYLLASITEWQTTLDAIEYAIVILDQFGQVVRLNQAAKVMLNKSSEEIVGQPIDAVGLSRPWQKIVELVSKVRETHSRVSWRLQDELQGTTWNVTANPIVVQATGAERIIIVSRDVTQEQRNEIMTATELSIIDIAHQVRNPLFGISSTLEFLEAILGNREEYREYFAVLRKEIHTLNNLMGSLLDYGRPPIQELSQEVAEDVIDQAICSCLPLAKQLGIHLLNCAQKGTSPILVDRKQLTQAFINLIENAIQHSPPGGTVQVEVKEVCLEKRTRIECNIKDNGPGISGEDISKIFEPFYTRRHGGTGLGLAIARRIVEWHGGIILAGNRSEGGAVFRVIFQPA